MFPLPFLPREAGTVSGVSTRLGRLWVRGPSLTLGGDTGPRGAQCGGFCRELCFWTRPLRSVAQKPLPSVTTWQRC